MMLTGRVLDAHEGLQFGLSTYVVEAGQGLAKGLALAQKIAGQRADVQLSVIQALPRIAELPPAEGLFVESLMAAIAQGEPAAKERLRAFLDKRAGKVGKENAEVARYSPAAVGGCLQASFETRPTAPCAALDRAAGRLSRTPDRPPGALGRQAPERTFVARRGPRRRRLDHDLLRADAGPRSASGRRCWSTACRPSARWPSCPTTTSNT
jgi:hypothetical protein